MATFEKRGALQWRAKVRRRGHPTQSKTFNTKAEAEAWATVVESEMARGVFISRTEAESTTLEECLRQYLAEVTPLKKGAEQERYKIGIILKHPICKSFMAGLRGADLARYRDDRLKAVSGGTVNREMAILSNVFNVARREWGMESLQNPLEVVRKPKNGRARDRRLREGELEAILAASQSTELAGVLLLALESSMRRGELAGLLWRHVHLKERFLVLPDTKNGEQRAVPISSRAAAALKELDERAPRDKDGDRIDERVFPMRGDSITQAFGRARDSARAAYLEECTATSRKPAPGFLEDLRFHDMRHEAASRFFEKGLQIMEVATITGHKDLRMLKRYTHLKASDLAEKLG